MEVFPCKLTIQNMPQSVKAYENVNIEANIEIYDPAITLGFIFLSIPDTGELLRFAKKEENSYILSYQVPYVPSGDTYTVGVYATSDSGLKTETQHFDIRIL